MSGFQAMIDDLKARGLIDDERRLTDAGNAHVDRLLEDLKLEEAPEPPAVPVRWNNSRGRMRA